MVNDAGVSPSTVASVEWALQGQVNRQLSPVWQTPHITFAPGGWQLILAKGPLFHGLIYGLSGCAGPGVIGCHWQTTTGAPVAAVWVWGRFGPWSVTASHELLETLVDPSGLGEEICDPVENVFYPYRGEYVSAFVTPQSKVIDHWRESLL